jgi:hypothetical protein
VDIDQNELYSLMAYYNMRFRYGVSPELWRTGYGGVHLIVRDLPLTSDEVLQERQLFRDDKNRIWLDFACPMKPMSTLFFKKAGDSRTRERWSLDQQGLLAMPFWISRMPPKWFEKRRRRVARER